MSDDEATVSCPMRRLGASRMPAWAVAEFAGAEACAALCLASREWDAAVASSPLWAARVRRAAPLTFNALCAARHPMAAAETVARIPFDRPSSALRTSHDAPFGLRFAPARAGQRRESLSIVEDLDSVFLNYPLACDPSAQEYKVLHSPLFVAAAPSAALETAPVPSAFAAAVDGEVSVEMRARAAQGLGRSAAAAAAALESGNWRAIAALLPALRELPFGPAMGKKKKAPKESTKSADPPLPWMLPADADGDAEQSPESPSEGASVSTKSSSFYPTAGAPKSAAIVEAIAGSAPNAGAHVGVADQESAAQYALKTTPMSVGYCRTEKEMANMRMGRCREAVSDVKAGLAALFKKRVTTERRLLMIGVEDSGKTTFLYQLKLGEIVTTIPTIGFNVESCGSPRKKFNLTMWDIGGQIKIRPLWRHYYSNTNGIVFFVNSTSLFHVYEGRENFKKTVLSFASTESAKKTTLTVVCTKQDLPGAVLPEAVAAAFMSITLAELPNNLVLPDSPLGGAAPSEPSPKRIRYIRENPGGPLLSQFGAWRFVGCNTLSRESCVAVAGIIEDDLEQVLRS